MIENSNSTNSSFIQEEESAIQIIDLWHMVWDHKWWYVISVFVCLLFAGVYLYRTPDTYTRSAKVIIDESDQDATMRNLGVMSANMMRLRSLSHPCPPDLPHRRSRRCQHRDHLLFR